MPETLTQTSGAGIAGSTLATVEVRERRKLLPAAGRAARTVVVSTIGLIVLFALWQFLPKLGIVNETFITPFFTVVSTWWHLLREGVIWHNASASLVRAGSGFVAAILIGVPLGLLIGWYSLLNELLSPVLELFRNTAPLSLLPVFVLILGIGDMAKIVFITYACLWPILLSTISAVRTVDPLLIKSAHSLGLKPLRIFQKIVLPYSTPTIFTGIRLSGSFALLVLVASELIGANSGLGYMVIYSEQNFDVPNMYAAILTITMLGVCLNYVLLRLERRFSSWRTA